MGSKGGKNKNVNTFRRGHTEFVQRTRSKEKRMGLCRTEVLPQRRGLLP